jgi:hypothetical protein
MTLDDYTACTCEDNVPGGPCLRNPPDTPDVVNTEAGKILFRCEDCHGFLLVNVDWHGNATIEAPKPVLLLAYFPEWFQAQAALLKITIDILAKTIGKKYIKTPLNKMIGCTYCQGIHPYEPDPRGKLTVVSTQGWGTLLQCPKCKVYKWLSYEVHGFAEIPTWGFLTVDALLTFKDFLEAEAAKKNITIEDFIEEILNNCL